MPEWHRVPPPARGRAVLPVQQPQHRRPPGGARSIYGGRHRRRGTTGRCSRASARRTSSAWRTTATTLAGSRSSTWTSSSSPARRPAAMLRSRRAEQMSRASPWRRREHDLLRDLGPRRSSAGLVRGRDTADSRRPLSIGSGRRAGYFVYDGPQGRRRELPAVARRPDRAGLGDLLRINHYFTRSQEERRPSSNRPGILHGKLVPKHRGVEERDRRLNEEADPILVPYGRAVRAACARARGRASPLPSGALEAALGA